MTWWFPFPSDGARPSRSPAELARPGVGSHSAWERGTPSPAVPSASATCETGGPAQAPGSPRNPARVRDEGRSAGRRLRVGGEARPGNEWVGGRGGAVGHRHSLRKTRYSRVKGAARSSLLKPLMVPLTSRRHHRATSPHAAPTDKEKAPRLRTAETGPESGAGNCFKRPPHPPPPGPRPAQAHSARPARPLAPAPPPGPALAGQPPSSQAGPRGWRRTLALPVYCHRPECSGTLTEDESLRQLGTDRQPLPHRAHRELSTPHLHPTTPTPSNSLCQKISEITCVIGRVLPLNLKVCSFSNLRCITDPTPTPQWLPGE